MKAQSPELRLVFSTAERDSKISLRDQYFVHRNDRPLSTAACFWILFGSIVGLVLIIGLVTSMAMRHFLGW